MKKVLYLIIYLFAAFFLSSCSNKDEKKENTENKTNEVINSDDKKQECEYTAELFRTFVQIKYGATKEDVIKILGEPDESSVDGEITRMEYLPIEGIPLIIWVNTTNNKVETIRLEVLGIGEYLTEDIQNAIKEYKIDECTASIIGKDRRFIEEKFGKPAYSGKEETTDVIDYYNDDSSIQVTLKFWQEQDYKCTQINMNWYYD